MSENLEKMNRLLNILRDALPAMEREASYMPDESDETDNAIEAINAAQDLENALERMINYLEDAPGDYEYDPENEIPERYTYLDHTSL